MWGYIREVVGILFSPAAAWVTLPPSFLGVLWHLWFENCHPGMPRDNMVLNRWREAWDEVLGTALGRRLVSHIAGEV